MFKKIINNKLFLIFVLALVIRLGFLIFFSPIPLESSDAPYYNEVALNIISGKGITYRQETFSIPPAYPLFLAGIFKIFGQSYDAVRIVQAILSALTCVLIYLTAKNLFNRKVGLIAGLIAVIYPSFILQSTAILTETLFTFLLVLTMFCLFRALDKGLAGWGLAAGISLGLATLTRSVTLFFPVLILPLVFLYKKRQPIVATFRNFILILILMFLVISPWAFKDSSIVRQVDLVKKIINKDFFSQALSNIYKLYGHPYALSDVTSYGYREVFSKFIHGQASFKELMPILKQATFWTKLGILLFYYLILAMALLGLALGYKNWRKFLPLILIIVYMTLPHIIPEAVGRVNARYVFPIMPFIIVLSAYGMSVFISIFLSKQNLRKVIKFG